MEITNTFAFFGYVCIFLDRFRYMLTSKFNASLVILVTGLFTFIVYYFNEICEKTDYATQLRTRQIAHTMFIIYILTTVFIVRKFKLYYLVAFIAHALFLFNVSTNTNQLTAHVSMSAYFALILAITINGDYSGILVLGQIMLVVFYAVGAYKLIIQQQPSSVLGKINPTIVKCPVKNADKTDTTQERVKQ